MKLPDLVPKRGEEGGFDDLYAKAKGSGLVVDMDMGILMDFDPPVVPPRPFVSNASTNKMYNFFYLKCMCIHSSLHLLVAPEPSKP